MRPEVGVVRAAEVALEAGDAMAVVYVGQGGARSRITAARATGDGRGVIGLVDWEVEPGFDHVAIAEDGGTVHRLARTQGAPR